MKNTHFHSLIDLAECFAQGRLHGRLGLVARGGAVRIACSQAALHQGAHGRLVGAVAQTIALCNLYTLLR